MIFALALILSKHVELLLEVTHSILHVYYDIQRNPKNGGKMVFNVKISWIV